MTTPRSRATARRAIAARRRSIARDTAGINDKYVTGEHHSRRRKLSLSKGGRVNMRGAALSCFLEGPCFDQAGNLYVADIPFGRIFRISHTGEWSLRCQYDGWRNGLKIHRDGTILIADYRRGILRLAKDAKTPDDYLTSYRSEGFKGCNDLFISAASGDLFFTAQGQRVYTIPQDGFFAPLSRAR